MKRVLSIAGSLPAYFLYWLFLPALYVAICPIALAVFLLANNRKGWGEGRPGYCNALIMSGVFILQIVILFLAAVITKLVVPDGDLRVGNVIIEDFFPMLKVRIVVLWVYAAYQILAIPAVIMFAKRLTSAANARKD